MTRPPPLLRTQAISSLVALIDRGRLEDAESDTRALLAIHPDAGILWKILSVSLLRQGKDALHSLRQAAHFMPNDAESQTNLATALVEQGQWTDALFNLNRALELEPNNAEALKMAADSLKALGRAGDAIPLYRRALVREPNSVEALNNLGNALLALGECDEAADCYRRALQSAPDRAQIHCNLGNALRQLARLDEAADSSRRAIALDPSLSAAHNNLGLVLAGLGQRELAIASFRQALILDPCSVEALTNVADVLRDLGARSDAWKYYTRALELDPARAETHCALGTLLLELRRYDEAAKYCAHALTLNPRLTMAHLSMAAARRGQGRSAEAEECCRTALAINPRSVEALSVLGELRADRGLFSEAEGLFQKAIEIDCEFPFPLFNIAANRKMTLEDTRWLAATQALLCKPLTLRNEISLRFALGKYFDDVKDYDDAFGHYRQANELTKRFGIEYDAARVSRQGDAIMGNFESAAITRMQAHANASVRPVFIVGMPRSGTTLTEQILASHPDVFGAGELPFWQAALASLHTGAPGRADSGGLPLRAIASEYLASLARLSPDAQRVIDKMPQNFKNVGLIHAAFPNAKIIHVRRDPIDTCLSIYFHYFSHLHPYANDLENLAHYYTEYVRLTDHWRSVIPATTLLEVPYEALISDQELWSRRMIEFIDLPWDAKCLDFHATDRVVITLSKWQVRQKIHGASAGRWRNYEQHIGPLRRLTNRGTVPEML